MIANRAESDTGHFPGRPSHGTWPPESSNSAVGSAEHEAATPWGLLLFWKPLDLRYTIAVTPVKSPPMEGDPMRRSIYVAAFSAVCLYIVLINADITAEAALPQTPGYTAAEFEASKAAGTEQNPQAKLKLLDAFTAQYPNSVLTANIYMDYYKTYFSISNYPQSIDYIDKLLAIGDKIERTGRWWALRTRAEAYILGCTNPALQSTEASQKAKDSAERLMELNDQVHQVNDEYAAYEKAIPLTAHIIAETRLKGEPVACLRLPLPPDSNPNGTFNHTIQDLRNDTYAQDETHTQIQPSTRKEFEVASIKPNISPLQWGGASPFTTLLHGGRFTAINVTLLDLIGRGYVTGPAQVQGGPSWVASQRFDVMAKADDSDGDVTGARMNEMIQTLLEKRFKLVLHRETKEVPLTFVVLGKNQPGLQESKEGEKTGWEVNSRGQMVFTRMPILGLINILSNMTQMPIRDGTGMSGFFDFTLDPAQLRHPGIAMTREIYAGLALSAVQEQLGFKLERRKGPLAFTIIDHAEMPTEN